MISLARSVPESQASTTHDPQMTDLSRLRGKLTHCHFAPLPHIAVAFLVMLDTVTSLMMLTIVLLVQVAGTLTLCLLNC